MSPENIKQAFKEGKYSSVGSYPLFWVYRDECLCVECAKEKEEEFLEDSENVSCEPNWENTSLHCDECGNRIEWAYSLQESQFER